MRWLLGTFFIFSSTLVSASDVCVSDLPMLLDQVTEIETNFQQHGKYRRGDLRILGEIADMYEKENAPYLTSRLENQAIDSETVMDEIVDGVVELRKNSKTISPKKIRKVYTDHPQYNNIFASPVKIGSNTFYFSKRTYLSPGKTTPRRSKNLRRMIEGKNPIAVNLLTHRIMKTEDHHVAQKPEDEIIVQISKASHKGNHGKLHHNFKKSEIKRGQFRSQQTKARKLRGIRDTKKYLEKKIKSDDDQ